MSHAKPLNPRSRLALAAARVVMRDGYAAVEHGPGDLRAVAEWVDWEQTLALRLRLDAAGLGIAEAMDTAQRYEIGWDLARALIERTGALELRTGFVAGAGIDHAQVRDLDGLVLAWSEQVALIAGTGGVPVLLCLPELLDLARDEDAFVRAYGRVIDKCAGPVLIHWLGPSFHPGLAGYFPGSSFERVMAWDRDKVRGCKLSLLDAAHERRVRVALAPHGQAVLTGDDHHFADLILGESEDILGEVQLLGRTWPLGAFSHALLGAFEGLHAPLPRLLTALAEGRRAEARAGLLDCEAFGQVVFERPTPAYKTGLAFRAWANGEQTNALLPFHRERDRDREHLTRVARAARAAGALEDPGAAERLTSLGITLA
jgi:hypothetical protein